MGHPRLRREPVQGTHPPAVARPHLRELVVPCLHHASLRQSMRKKIVGLLRLLLVFRAVSTVRLSG